MLALRNLRYVAQHTAATASASSYMRVAALQQQRCNASLFSQLVDKTRPLIKEMDPQEAYANQSKYTWVDVREEREWQEKGVIDVDHLEAIERGVLERDLPKRVPDTSTPLMLYCAGAMRSVLAARSLNELGYDDVTSLNGGYGQWAEEGLPTKPYSTVEEKAEGA